MSKKRNCFNCIPRNNCDFCKNSKGYCCFYILKDHALIFNLYVYEEYRNQGVAKNLLKRCINKIRATGFIGEIRIQAEPKENSIPKDKLVQFYKSLGLTVVEK